MGEITKQCFLPFFIEFCCIYKKICVYLQKNNYTS
jgi:hypothetical protein